MVKSLRFGTALTALGLIGALAACASPGTRMSNRASIFGDKVDSSNIGIATRAQIAVEKGDYATGITLAERAVGNTPNDAGFRALLGNAYFGGGRFASAESAYRDSLSLFPNQPQVVLKLALVTIAQGKTDAALAVLESARNVLDPSDYGLALALAGQPQAAVSVLDAAAREVGADSRVRQNLALAHALTGDWAQARNVASQDVAADQVDARIQQWMTFAKPTKASDQVASMTGFTPAAVDPGQPVRLALVQPKSDIRLAQAAPVEVGPVEVGPVQVGPVAEPAPPMVAEVAPVEVAVDASVAEVQPESADAPVEAAEPAPAPVVVAAALPIVAVEQVRAMAEAIASPVIEAAYVAPTPVAAKPGLSPRAASLSDGRLPLRRAAFGRASGNSRSVVQLGAYSSRAFVSVAWTKLAAKYPALRGYSPATARFEGPRGTVYRLSVSGFNSGGHAQQMCAGLKTRGAACFVRSVAGDVPVRMASL
ncbi:MAG: tetratricopeptide repeat protein [Sphingomonas bacterium]|nr:tetratricopeptide repeat protein [Sphingomonas bacterium]